MPVNYFIKQPREWLEKQLAQCQEDIAVGKTLIQWGAGDSSGIRRVQLTPQLRFQQIYYALYLIAPDDYPATGLAPTNRTRAVFS
jgi:hypothetical protein